MTNIKPLTIIHGPMGYYFVSDSQPDKALIAYLE